MDSGIIENIYTKAVPSNFLPPLSLEWSVKEETLALGRLTGEMDPDLEEWFHEHSDGLFVDFQT